MADQIRCMIIDDEEMAIKVIESYIERVDVLKLEATSQNAFEAFNILHQTPVDLIFLDIQMPQMTGLEFLKSLQHPPKVILTTAYRDFAVDGFELDVLDYLLKPISFSRFLKSIARITKIPQAPVEQRPVLRETDHTNDYIYVKSGKSMEKINYRDVLYIESYRDNVAIHTTKRKVTTYLKISYLEQNLPPELFMRIHKSYMVAISKISSYTTAELQVEDKTIPIGNFYKKQVLEHLNNEGTYL